MRMKLVSGEGKECVEMDDAFLASVATAFGAIVGVMAIRWGIRLSGAAWQRIDADPSRPCCIGSLPAAAVGWRQGVEPAPGLVPLPAAFVPAIATPAVVVASVRLFPASASLVPAPISTSLPLAPALIPPLRVVATPTLVPVPLPSASLVPPPPIVPAPAATAVPAGVWLVGRDGLVAGLWIGSAVVAPAPAALVDL